MSGSAHYRAPGWFTRNVFNRLVGGLTRAGIKLDRPERVWSPPKAPKPPYRGDSWRGW